MSSWREMIAYAMQDRGDTWDNVVSIAVPDTAVQKYPGDPNPIQPDLDTPFNSHSGGIEGCPFTVWTHHYVYFPEVYDGAESVASVSRNPDGVPTEHVGGW